MTTLLALSFFVFLQSPTALRPPRPLADMSVFEIQSHEVRGHLLRAVKGYEDGYVFLIIERIVLPSGDGGTSRLAQSWRLQEIDGGAAFKDVLEGDDISDLRWVGEQLEFRHKDRYGNETCSVARIEAMKPIVSCKSNR